jgi:hypothetical protein
VHVRTAISVDCQPGHAPSLATHRVPFVSIPQLRQNDATAKVEWHNNQQRDRMNLTLKSTETQVIEFYWIFPFFSIKLRETVV